MSDESNSQIPADLTSEIDRLVRDDRALHAIKLLREKTGLGLRDSKAFVCSRMEPVKRPKLPCPYCEKLLRTDKAQQCLECGMDWHDSGTHDL